MKKVNKDDIDFRGIIVSVPKESFKGDNYAFSFEVEDAYTTQGKHGYPEQGKHPTDSSFFSICYDLKDYLPKGLFFNRTSGFTLDHQFGNKFLDYYKFDDMEEFCKWYLNRIKDKEQAHKELHEINTQMIYQDIYEDTETDNDLKEQIENVHIEFTEHSPKLTRREIMQDVITYINKVLEIKDFEKTLEGSKPIGDLDVRYIELQNYKRNCAELENWLNEKV